MSSLKPCANCGSTDIESEDCSNMQTNGTRIVCNSCGVMVEGYGGSTCTARATAKWNTRSSDATAECLAGLLREALRDLHYLNNIDGEDGDLPDRITEALAAYDAERKSIASDQRAADKETT